MAKAINLSYNERFPILLPTASRFSYLLIDFIHRLTLHGGNHLLLRVLRIEFYIRRAKNLIKTVIGCCRTCTIYKGMTQSQIMAALPTSRTVFTHHFTSTGVDFAEPFDIRNYTVKACLITTLRLSIHFLCYEDYSFGSR